jgi:phosphomannomutase
MSQTTFRKLGPQRQDAIGKHAVQQIEQALAKIGMDPDGVLVMIDDGERVAAAFNGTEHALAMMVECVNRKYADEMGTERKPCCKPL